MEVLRTFDLLEKYKEKFVVDDALAVKRNKKWEYFSTHDYIENSHAFARGMLALGYEKGDKIATITNNRPEWNFVDMGLSMAGLIHVPIYPTINEEEFYYILNHCDAKAVILSDKILFRKIETICKKIDQIRTIYTFNEVEDALNWQTIIDEGNKQKEKFAPVLEKLKSEITQEDVVSIIYTSGTTGNSKGVMLTHKNLVSNFIATSKIQPLTHEHKVLSFLPLSHVYERMVNYHFQYLGIRIYYAENMGSIVDNLKEIKADGFNSVPRLLEKVFDKIIAKGKDLTGIKKVIFFWAVNIGLRFELNNANGWFYEFKLKIARKLVFDKWREALGGSVQMIVSGGSALQPRLARIFYSMGMKIMEGYGLTETSPVIAVNYPDYPKIRFGTVGPVIEDVEVKIADDGEILTKGPNLMKGYYKDPGYTKEVIDSEGWFHTGDIGVLEDGKFLKITDRKKEIFKNSAGKYIAPQLIENKLKESFFIEQAMVVGENEKFISALIAPNFPFLHDWCSRRKIHYRDNENLIKLPEIIKRLQKEVDEVNKRLNQVEQIKRFRLVCKEWTPATGELSPTLKLKRKFLYKEYIRLLEDIYQRSTNSQAFEKSIDKAKRK
ncbi:MAG: long-chain fatty acid--CoA ligase [Bacteroidota bacterium]|nr:long-chain fatty acid--CoA ligase [Bacteroidota bacterium]